jgi:hypothetical protein
MGSNCTLNMASVDLLQDLYVQKNQLITKHYLFRYLFWPVAKSSILFQASEDPIYNDKRKALSTVFFKSRLAGMTKIIKSVTLN